MMTAGTVGATVALHRLAAYKQRLPEPVARANPVLQGTLLGGACWLGELPNSFLKRRLGIPPGQQRASPAGVAISILDQADWVPMAWLLLRPVWAMSVREAAQAFLLVAAIHVPINLIGYAIGARTASL
jgi:CDP-archaeol synthase